MGDHMTEAELRDRVKAIGIRMNEIDTEFRNTKLPKDVSDEFDAIDKERDELRTTLEEIEYRKQRIAEGEKRGEVRRESGADFYVQSRKSDDEVFEYGHIAHGAHSPEQARSMFRSQALSAVERTTFHQPGVRQEDAQGHVEKLLEKDNEQHEVARRILNTGSGLYQRAFGKAMFQKHLSSEESRALSLTNTAGGYAVPFTLDPTVIPTSNYSVNPYRKIARNIQITTTTWQGITSAGITVSRVAEGTEAGDNSPTLAQPSATPQRVQGFIPFSIEIGQDWTGMQTDVAQALADAKDDEEATSFTTGTGTPPAPQGIITGATNTTAATGVASFAVSDVYKLEEALPPRFRPNAQWLASRFIYNKIRQFDTAGGASLWVQSLREALQSTPSGTTGYDLIGYPANESSATAAALTTGSKIAVLGDWRYFAIVDRVGMDIELVPHIFGAANRRPIGQRGWYAFWRNTSIVIDPNAFRVLVTG